MPGALDRTAGLSCDLIGEMRPDEGGSSRKLITFVRDRPWLVLNRIVHQ